MTVFVIFSVKLVISIELIRSSQNNYEFPNISHSKFGEYHLMSTSKFNHSFSHTIGKWSSNRSVDNPTVTYVEIDRRNPYKMSKFVGFGSTFTDSDIEIFQQMPSTSVDYVFENYFSANGLNFELLRVPIDRNFETKQKIYVKRPLLKIVAVIRPKHFGSSAEPNAPNLTDPLIKLAKSLNNKNKIEMLSLDCNLTERIPNFADQAHQIRKLITTFNQNTTEFEAPKICLTDCTRRIEQPWLFQLEKSRINILDKIDMISLTNHCVPSKFLCRAYKKYRKPILFTKSEELNQFSTIPIDLWQRVEELIDRIMSLLHQNIVGYFENSLISHARGMHATDTLIMFDGNDKKLRKLPAFYATAHFSRHILSTSERLAATLCGPMTSSIQTVAYLRPDAKVLVLLYNSNEISIPVTVVDKRIGKFDIILPPKSINSIVYCI